jgi:hypothetical protein
MFASSLYPMHFRLAFTHRGVKPRVLLPPCVKWWPRRAGGGGPALFLINQPKFMLAVAVGLRPSQVVRSTALGLPFPELLGYSAPCPCVRVSPRLLRFL